MKHNGDIIFGTIGTAGTALLSTVNVYLACIAGVFTCLVMALKLRREWLHRNDPPEE